VPTIGGEYPFQFGHHKIEQLGLEIEDPIRIQYKFDESTSKYCQTTNHSRRVTAKPQARSGATGASRISIEIVSHECDADDVEGDRFPWGPTASERTGVRGNVDEGLLDYVLARRQHCDNGWSGGGAEVRSNRGGSVRSSSRPVSSSSRLGCTRPAPRAWGVILRLDWIQVSLIRLQLELCRSGRPVRSEKLFTEPYLSDVRSQIHL
jgi:hypothetical protein